MDNAYLLYMTGLSVDKKRMNNIMENIHDDRDMKLWYDHIHQLATVAFSKRSEKLDELREGSDDYATFLNAFLWMFGAKIPFLKSIIEKLFDVLLHEKNTIRDINPILESFISNAQITMKEYDISDFFRLYVSHQSDSMGVMPIARVAQEKGFSFTNTYCDRDYFENRYVDHIVVKLDKKKYAKLRENWQGIFNLHLFDIYASKVLFETLVDREKKQNIFQGVFDLHGTQNTYVNDMKSAFSERNLFGVSLLSYFFAFIQHEILGNKEVMMFKPGNENDVDNEFLKELLEYSADPSALAFTEEKSEACIEARVYFSDGKKILNKNLENDTFYKLFSTKEEETVTSTLFSDLSLSVEDYCKEAWDDIYIKLPVKMMLSLPVDQDGNASQSITIPHMVDSGQAVVDILTVGGAEHNRALAHLINKHRFQYKEDRVFGFLDNYSDLIHKLKFLDAGCLDHQESFLMALNQPVAGYNAIFAQRRDVEDGVSSALETKVIGYSLMDMTDTKRRYNIVSIYGFSALSSVYAIHNVVAGICTQEGTEIFNPNRHYTPGLKRNPRTFQNDAYVQKGLASLYRYKGTGQGMPESQKIIYNKFEQKHPLYIFNTQRDDYIKMFEYSEGPLSIFDGDIQRGRVHDR